MPSSDEVGLAAKAAQLYAAHAAVHETFRQRDGSSSATEVWQSACGRLREAERSLYGPLDGVHRRVRAADIDAIEIATRFLEADPWCFRSGYMKARLSRALGNVPLDDHYAARLRKVVLKRIDRPETGLLRPTAVLAANLWDDDLGREIGKRFAAAGPAQLEHLRRFRDAVEHKMKSTAGETTA